MANVFVVGDSVAQGIASAIPNARNLGIQSATVPGMAQNFATAINDAQRGDTVIVSAGYNGFTNEHATQLQGWIQQLRDKGANVVIAGLREAGMDASINAQYTATNRQLQQIATATGATFGNECIAIGNRNPAGNVHGGYNELAQACLAAAGASAPAAAPATAPSAAAAPATGGATAPAAGTPRESDRQADAAGTQQSGGNWFTNILQAILKFFTETVPEFFSSLFGGGDQQSTGNGAAAGNGGAARTLQQEISDVTAALGVRGQSGALQDNTINDAEKNTIKTELQQVRAALPSTMTDSARAEVTALLTSLREGGVQDGDAILGQSITDLTTAMRASGASAPSEASAPAAPGGVPAATGPAIAPAR